MSGRLVKMGAGILSLQEIGCTADKPLHLLGYNKCCLFFFLNPMKFTRQK